MLKWDDLSRLWSQGKWGNIYLFAGQEDFLIEQALHQAQDHWLKDDHSGLNLERFDAEKDKAGAVIQSLQTLPFLAAARVIRIDQASDFLADEQKQIAETLQNLSPETRVIFIWGREWKSKDASSALVKGITAAGGEVVVFWPLFPENALRWIQQRAKTYQKSITSEAATWLLHDMGEGLRRLDQELAKCAAYVGGRPEIEIEDVQSCAGYGRSVSPYAWMDAIRQKRTDQALKLLKELLEEGEEPIALMALISRSLRNWLSAKHPRETSTSLSMRFFLRRGQEGAFIQELKRWSEEDLTDGIQACVQAESSVKSGRETPETALTMLCLRLGRLETGNLQR